MLQWVVILVALVAPSLQITTTVGDQWVTVVQNPDLPKPLMRNSKWIIKAAHPRGVIKVYCTDFRLAMSPPVSIEYAIHIRTYHIHPHLLHATTAHDPHYRYSWHPITVWKKSNLSAEQLQIRSRHIRWWEEERCQVRRPVRSSNPGKNVVDDHRTSSDSRRRWFSQLLRQASSSFKWTRNNRSRTWQTCRQDRLPRS